MENGEVVNEAPAPSIEDQMLDALSEDEGSQPSDTDGDTIEEPGSDTEEVEAQDEQVEDEWRHTAHGRAVELQHGFEHGLVH